MKSIIFVAIAAFFLTACSQRSFVSIVEDDNGQNVINTQGERILNESYDKVFLYDDEYVKIMEDKKYGIVNYDGEILIEPVYDDISPLYNGYATITSDKKVGLIDEDMRLIMEPSYDSVKIEEGHFIVRNASKYYCMNKQFKIISSAYDKIYYYVDGVARVEINDKLGFIDESCKELTAIQYDYASDFINGYAKVKLGDKFTFLDKKMNQITEAQFKNANYFEGK